MTAAPADALERALSRRLGGTVRHLTRLSGGASRTTWAFDLSRGPDAGVPDRRCVVQVSRAAPSANASTMRGEARLLAAAARAGVPVPAVVASGEGSDGDGFTAPYIVTERLEGETIPRKLLRDPQYAGARTTLVPQAAAALAAIHSIPLDEAEGLGGGDQLEQFTEYLHAFTPPRPALELALRRLKAQGAAHTASGTPTVVHGDFRTGNLLVDTDGLRAVLDWELAHVGDPLEDLGWFCVRAWRFGGPGRAGGFGSDDELVAAYERASGRIVDRATVRWWEAVGTFKWAVMCMIQAASHRVGGRSSVELATIGRRVCENEWDLLRALGAPRADEIPLADAPATGSADADELFGRPTAAELVEAVRQFADDLVGEAGGRTQFTARVAATAAGIVGRQLALQPQILDRQRARLGALGFRDPSTLVDAIRGGECDGRFDEVAGALLGSVADQLAVSNPRYLEPEASG